MESYPLEVVLRFRPSYFFSKFFSIEGTEIVYKSVQQTFDNKTCQISRRSSFSSVLSPSTSQDQVFEKTAFRLVKDFFNGVSGLIFAYGLTNSGKTYTLQGTDSDGGIIPRLLEAILTEYNSSDKAIYATTAIAISYGEIYQEKAFDLLGNPTLPLKIIQNQNGTAIQGLSYKKVTCLRDALETYRAGNLARHSSSTSFNKHSSRSHSLFTIRLAPSSEYDGTRCFSSILVADLAGAEKTAQLTQVDSEPLPLNIFDESTKINSSLVVLGRVLKDLHWNQRNPGKMPRVIPWRDSAITRLLRNYFLGGGKCLMLVCAWITPETLSQTLRVLDYGAMSTSIRSQNLIDNRLPLNSVRNINPQRDLPEDLLHLLRYSIQTRELIRRMEALFPRALKRFGDRICRKFLKIMSNVMKENRLRIRKERKLAWSSALNQIDKMSTKYNLKKKIWKSKIKRVSTALNNKINAERFKNESFKAVIHDLEERVVCQKTKMASLEAESKKLKQTLSEQITTKQTKSKSLKAIEFRSPAVVKREIQPKKKFNKKEKFVPKESLLKRAVKKEAENSAFEFGGGGISKKGLYGITVMNLKGMLRHLGLKVGGVKSELIDRLWNVVSSDITGDKQKIVVDLVEKSKLLGREKKKKTR